MRNVVPSFYRRLKTLTFWAIIALVFPVLHATNAFYQCVRLTDAARHAVLEATRTKNSSVTVKVEDVCGVGPHNNWGNSFHVTARVENGRRSVSITAATSDYPPVLPSQFAWPFMLSGVLATAAASILYRVRFRVTPPGDLLRSVLALLLLLEVVVLVPAYYL